MPTTLIKNADWVIAWDAAAGRQVYRRGVDLAFSGGRIEFLGSDFAGAADRVIDGAGLMVMPGLIDIHSHPHHEPLYRGIREEHGVANMHMTGLYERGQAFSAPDDEARAASAEFAYSELLLCGVTSLVDIGAVRRLDRAVRQKRPARLSRAGLRVGPLVSRNRPRPQL